jgi:hypothetical protein
VDITVYRCHSADCPEKGDRYAPRCGCPLAFQFNWKQDSTTLDGRKLKRGQNKWTAKTRSWSEAQINAKKLEKDLADLLQGKPVRHGVPVEAAVNEWLEFRQQNKAPRPQAQRIGGHFGQQENGQEIHESRNKQVQLLTKTNPLQCFVDASLFHQAVEPYPYQNEAQYHFHQLGDSKSQDGQQYSDSLLSKLASFSS